MHFVIKRFTSGIAKPQKQQHQEWRWRWWYHFTLRPAISLLSLGLILIILQGAMADESDDEKSSNVSTINRLHLQLFIHYNKNAHPTYLGEPTNVSLGLSVNYIDIDELNGKMTMHSWLNVAWRDENRSWNKSEYDNITTIHLKQRDIWRPDITLFNKAGDGQTYIGDTQIVLTSDGSFLWVPPVIYTTFCSLNLRMWPYDIQTCKVKVGSWTSTLVDRRDSLDFTELVQSTEWEIKDGTASFRQKDYYNYMEYTLVLQRRSTMYTAVIFTPASCIVLLALSTFWLPPQMGEKILLNCIIIVVIAAFLMYFAQLLPILAQNTPLVVLFYSSSLLMLSLSTLIAVVVLYLSTAKHKRRVPDMLKNALNGRLGSILLLSQFTLEAESHATLNNSTKELSENVYDSPDNESISEHVNINPSPTNRSLQFDWILLATAVDRIAFLCFGFVFLIIAIVYLAI